MPVTAVVTVRVLPAAANAAVRATADGAVAVRVSSSSDDVVKATARTTADAILGCAAIGADVVHYGYGSYCYGDYYYWF